MHLLSPGGTKLTTEKWAKETAKRKVTEEIHCPGFDYFRTVNQVFPPAPAPGSANLAHPQFLSNRTPLPTRVRKEKGGAHVVQAGKIRIIILRRFIIPWTGPVREKFAGGDGSAQFFPWSDFPAGLSLRRRGRRVPRK